MDESVKKGVMLGVIVVCLVAAGVITVKTRRGGSDTSPFKDQSTWVKCRNKACGAAYEMNLKKYYDFILENADPGILETPALTCKECDEPSVYRAVKCGGCELIFEENTVPNDFSDRCPKPECGYSQKQIDRKNRAEELRKKAEERKK